MVYAYADGSWNFDDQLNTGVCGVGVVIYNDNKKLGSFGKSFLGVENSQIAEAKAVMCALTYCVQNKHKKVTLFNDQIQPDYLLRNGFSTEFKKIVKHFGSKRLEICHPKGLTTHMNRYYEADRISREYSEEVQGRVIT